MKQQNRSVHMNLGRKSSGKDVGETGGEDGFSKNTLYTGMKFSNI